MASIDIPFLFARSRAGDIGGRPKLGWSDVPVDIDEADPDDFDLATCETFSSDVSRSTYAGRGAFWMSAILPNLSTVFNSAGIAAETLIDTSQHKNALWWKRMIGEVPAKEVLRPIMDKAGKRMPAISHTAEFRAVFALADVAERDVHFYREWAKENLVACQGKLFKKVHSTSLVISGRSTSGPLSVACETETWIEGATEYGCGEHRGGIHFEWPGEELDNVRYEAREQLGAHPHDLDNLWDMRQLSGRIRDAIGLAALSDRFEVASRTAFDKEIIESISGRQDMSERNVLGMAGMLGRTTQPHSQKPGRKRDVLMALKEAFATLPSDRPADFVDRMADLLYELPTEGEPARAWFVNKALDSWNDRVIAVPQIALTMHR